MLPEAFVERMRRMLGAEYEAFAETFGEERSQALRLNPLKRGADGRSAAAKYGADGSCGLGERDGSTSRAAGNPVSSKVPWAEDGYYYRSEEQPGKHPFHEAGVYYIQEPSAMAPAELLDVKPGERVLDLCAAPGGKSTQIAAKLQGRGILICNEIHPARARILSENIERMGICNACVTNETPEHLAELFPVFFDKILVDAPCSGEGMFRKNEAACHEWSPENVELCAKRQDKILDQAAGMLRPGGKLVYSTCTFAPEEDEGSVARFLCRHSDFTVLPIDKERLGLAGCDGGAEYPGPADMMLEHGNESDAEAVFGFRPEMTLRIWPQRVRGEGHYAALLQKAGVRERVLGGIDVQKGSDRENALVGTDVQKGSDRENALVGTDVQKGSDRENALGGIDVQRGSDRENALVGADVQKGMRGRKAGQDKDMEAFFSFCRENLQPSILSKAEGDDSFYAGIGRAVGMGEEVRILRFGENVYLVPAMTPSLRGLKVLRPGLQLGTLKKNRFEPSHALALALPPAYAAHVRNLDIPDQLVKAYLKGQTFPAQGEKGWYLICVDGFSIGWGKLAGGIMKNHYPIGLRRKDLKES